jgi:MFS family permease
MHCGERYTATICLDAKSGDPPDDVMCWYAMDHLTLVVLAFGLAVVTAARSTWSPCGISMLSTLTPLGERSRGHRYPATVGWFVAGAAAGGAVLGGLTAGFAALVGQLGASGAAIGIVVAVSAAVTIASDLRLVGFRLPTVPRQVDEVWTGRYRRWVYAAGFGAQIGVGLSTYVMTAAVYLTVVLAAMTGNPALGLLVGLTFGVLRGLAILLGAGLTTPEAIRRFHRRFESLAGVSLAVAVAAQLSVLAVATGPVGSLVVLAVAGCGLAFFRLRRSRRAQLRHSAA